MYLSIKRFFALLFEKMHLLIYTRGVNRAGPNAGRAGPGSGRFFKLRAGPNLGGPGRAEQFYNLLGIRAGFLQSFTRTNFLTI